MSSLEKALAEHLMQQDYGPEWRTLEPEPLLAHTEEARELAAVVAEWLTSGRAEDVSEAHHFSEVFGTGDLCECDRPDERDNPHRHALDVACIYWIAGRPSRDALEAAANGLLPLTETTGETDE